MSMNYLFNYLISAHQHQYRARNSALIAKSKLESPSGLLNKDNEVTEVLSTSGFMHNTDNHQHRRNRAWVSGFP